ncbi:MAG TPA: hypothetical protein VFE24_02580 [Pirellulales bacterium]|jgi:hypothetical protein|nr:hypothetical protein [Pirellulales bacterium]
MQTIHGSGKLWRGLLCGVGLMITACSVGCQSHIGGQSLPSPYYLQDDVQYFPPGTEFKLSKEAAAQRTFKEEQILQQGQAPQP